jgi:ankyrin repeat protein
MAELLLAAGSDPNAEFSANYNMLVDSCVRYDNADGVRLLLEHGAILERAAEGRVPNNDLCSPLGVAAHYGAIECARVLLDYGVDIETAVSRGAATVAHVAAEPFVEPEVLRQRGNPGNVLFFELCTEHGLSVNIRDALGETPLARDVLGARHDVVATLLEKWPETRGEINRENPVMGGRYLLHDAFHPDWHGAGKDREEVVRLLLEYGARPRPTDSKGKTPLDYARRLQLRNIKEIEHLLGE